MLVLMDESGDAGMKLGHGSSAFFCIVAVIFQDNFSAGSCDRTIDGLRRQLNLGPKYEFHFTECSNRIRESFVQAVKTEDFCYHAFVINKVRLFSNRFRNATSFYEFAAGIVCDNARELLTDARIIIDRHGSIEFKRRLQKSLKDSLRREDGTSLIKRVKMEASHTNNLVQLADMVCGSVARSITHPNDSKLRDLLRKANCEKRVQYWPK
jgi:hypothetical protein